MNSQNNEISSLEQEANYFAMCLLMPEQLLKADLVAMKPTVHDLSELCNKLAARYKVEPSLMAIRLGQIGVLKF